MFFSLMLLHYVMNEKDVEIHIIKLQNLQCAKCTKENN